MKKTMQRILALTIVFLMIITNPFYISENINNSPYVYAAATFTQTIESELFKKTLIPTLISAGLVFSSKESIEIAAEDTIEWLKEQGFDWKPPDEPDGPNLEDVIKEMLKAITLVSASHELVKGIVKIPKMLWNLIKQFVDDNYDEGENIIYPEGFWHKSYFQTPQIFPTKEYQYYYIYDNKGNSRGYYKWTSEDRLQLHNKNGSSYKVWTGQTDTITAALWYDIENGELKTGNIVGGEFNYSYINIYSDSEYITIFNINNYPSYHEFESIEGIEDIVDNSNYDWNNNYTDSKDIVIPLERDFYGDLKTDENGYYIPSIDTEDWVDIQPEEIPNLDPSGTPIPEIPEMPEVENPDDDEKTGIMVYIGNVLQTIVGQLSKLVEGVKTIVSNTNKLVFNTTNPELDPITGEPVEPAAAGDGIIGNGIDTRIPTDFEWGNFRHFLDIFFIFIYFIVILILIILKFLEIVFVGLPAIEANTGLLSEYPGILEGVNYVKNLQVGGLSITVHQAFEFVFLIFFYIFIIKQIRKMYNAHVYEESAENPRISQDMKMDYYENIKNKRWSDNK